MQGKKCGIINRNKRFIAIFFGKGTALGRLICQSRLFKIYALIDVLCFPFYFRHSCGGGFIVILGIDPGYATIGYGLVQYERDLFYPLRFGAITTPAGEPFSARLDMIFEDMCSLLKQANADAMAVEQLFFSKNKTTGIDVAHARGVILLSARRHNVPIYEYTPMQVKQSVVGYGLAEKAQVMEMTRQILKLEKVPRPDDTADALALAICHAHCCGSRLGALRTEREI